MLSEFSNIIRQASAVRRFYSLGLRSTNFFVMLGRDAASWYPRRRVSRRRLLTTSLWAMLLKRCSCRDVFLAATH